MLVGYMRISSDRDRQTAALQRDALLAVSIDDRHIYEDVRFLGTFIETAADVPPRAVRFVADQIGLVADGLPIARPHAGASDIRPRSVGATATVLSPILLCNSG